MVDRIVPAATPARLDAARQALGVADAAALGTEGFWEWVLERRFADPADAQALLSAGVTVVDEVDQFGAEQVVITTLINWLRTHRHLDAICKELVSIRSRSCNLSYRNSPQSPASARAGGVVQSRLSTYIDLRSDHLERVQALPVV
jgi:hypothetical protein